MHKNMKHKGSIINNKLKKVGKGGWDREGGNGE